MYIVDKAKTCALYKALKFIYNQQMCVELLSH